MPSKKMRAREKKAARQAAARDKPVPDDSKPVTLRQLERAHMRGVRRNFQHSGYYGDTKANEVYVGNSPEDIMEQAGQVPRQSEMYIAGSTHHHNRGWSAGGVKVKAPKSKLKITGFDVPRGGVVPKLPVTLPVDGEVDLTLNHLSLHSANSTDCRPIAPSPDDTTPQSE